MMNSAGEAGLLRPLTLGEIFDRALTLYVRNAGLFTLIVLAIILPLAVMQYFAVQHESGTFAQLIAQIEHPSKNPQPLQTGAQTGWTLLLILAAVVLNAFTIVAIAAAVGRLYRGEAAEWKACYTAALRRTGAILVTLLCEMATFVVVIFAGAFVMGAVFFAAFLLVRATAALGVVALIAGLLVVLVWLVALMLCYLAYAFAFNALGVEGTSAGSAIGAGFARIFNRGELLRATLFCLALIVIYFGFSVLTMSVAAILESFKLTLLYVIVNALISMVITALLGVLLVVYYFDVRVRREGLDLQEQIASLQPIAAP